MIFHTVPAKSSATRRPPSGIRPSAAGRPQTSAGAVAGEPEAGGEIVVAAGGAVIVAEGDADELVAGRDVAVGRALERDDGVAAIVLGPGVGEEDQVHRGRVGLEHDVGQRGRGALGGARRETRAARSRRQTGRASRNRRLRDAGEEVGHEVVAHRVALHDDGVEIAGCGLGGGGRWHCAGRWQRRLPVPSAAKRWTWPSRRALRREIAHRADADKRRRSVGSIARVRVMWPAGSPKAPAGVIRLMSPPLCSGMRQTASTSARRRSPAGPDGRRCRTDWESPARKPHLPRSALPSPSSIAEADDLAGRAAARRAPCRRAGRRCGADAAGSRRRA